jgi:histidine triad (HIT) family protein
MSLDGAYDQSNVFAKILRGELPCYKVFEDDVALAFMDLFPMSNGHTLIIPKIPARNLLDFPAAALGPYMERVQCTAAAVRTAMKPDGLRIFQMNGAPAGQTVFHLHFHIVPFYEGMTMGLHAGNKGDPEVLEANAAKIVKAIA